MVSSQNKEERFGRNYYFAGSTISFNNSDFGTGIGIIIVIGPWK